MLDTETIGDLVGIAVDGSAPQNGALCAQTDPDAFFPEQGESSWQAKRVCRACAVQTECLNYALARPGLVGIWGGTSVQERRSLRRHASMVT